jgi:hypothetical protein
MTKMDDPQNERSILEEKIRKLDEQIAVLTGLRQKLFQRLESINSASEILSPTPSSTRELTQEDKVALFMSYFRGRDDVYARLWTNDRTGKRGYSPACRNRISVQAYRLRCERGNAWIACFPPRWIRLSSCNPVSYSVLIILLLKS